MLKHLQAIMNIQYEQRAKGLIALIELQGLGTSNSLNKPIIIELYNALLEASQNCDGMIVYSQNPKFFCNGMDGQALLEQDEKTRVDWISTITSIYPKLIAIPKPWVSELNGYAMAGGAAIATASDFRIMINKGRIGFSEVLSGLALPLSYIVYLEQLCTPSSIRFLMQGKAYKPQEALDIGLIDQIVENDSPAENLRKASFKYFHSLFNLPKEALLSTRNSYKAKIVASMQDTLKQDLVFIQKFVTSPGFSKSIENIIQRN